MLTVTSLRDEILGRDDLEDAIMQATLDCALRPHSIDRCSIPLAPDVPLLPKSGKDADLAGRLDRAERPSTGLRILNYQSLSLKSPPEYQA